MKHTDEQIIATVHKILLVLHDPDTGFYAFHKELNAQHLTRKEYDQRILDKQYELAAKYGMTKEDNENEIAFKITGQDVMYSHLFVSCGQAAKAFCYVNSRLPKQEQLDLRILFSTDIEHFIDALESHTLPCVQLSDGKWHAIDPQIPPRKEYPYFPFVCDDIRVGGEIWHQIESIKVKNRPYQITKIITPQEYETTYSDFGKFLNVSRLLTDKNRFLFASLEQILQNLTPWQPKDVKRQIYEICKALDKKNITLKVWIFTKGEDTAYGIGFEQDGAYYNINPTVRYLKLNKNVSIADFGISKLGFILYKTLTPHEYIHEFETNNLIFTNTNTKGKE